MAYEVIPEPGEKVLAEVEVNFTNDSNFFYFAVSNQAVYIPRVKLYARTDPYYYQRVPLDQVRHVAVKRLRADWAWIVGGLMILFGVFTLYWMMEPFIHKSHGSHSVSGYPLAIIVGGILLPLAAKGRLGLEIWFQGGKYRWRPPFVVDKKSRQQVTDTFQSIVDGCQQAGLPVSDRRNPG
jgi:hypothetical protein